MPPLQLLLLVFFLGCATGALFMALLRRRAVAQVRREFEEQLHQQVREQVKEIRGERSPEPRLRAYDA